MRNCSTNFYGDEILEECHKFDTAYFESVRKGGYTAIWLRGQLRQLATFEEAPHWNDRNAERIEALNRIVEIGRSAGVNVYLYINEPKGFREPEPLFERYPDLKGPFNPLSQHALASAYEATHAFCTQCEFTERYLVGGFAEVFAKCPNLAGVITITASEILSHCFSNVDERNLLNEDFKYRKVECPRCAQSTSIATVQDVLEKIRRGIRQSSATARVVAWNWSWGMYEEAPQRNLIAGLDKEIIILCDMQRGGSKEVEGIALTVDEYSFSYLGPSPLFIGTAQAAHSEGHELWGKIMVNVTHEFLVVPYLPLFTRLAKKMIAMRDYDTRGLMGCWNYGGDATTPMARLASRIFSDDGFGTDAINPTVREIALELYGPERADVAVRAWQSFDEAFEYFPFDLFLIYYGPHMHGTGFEWVFTPEEIDMPWYFLAESGRRGTKLSEWCGSLKPEQVTFLFDKLTAQWAEGVRLLAESFGVENPFDALPNFDALLETPGFEDFNIARTVWFHLSSTSSFVKFRLATLAYFASPQGAQEQAPIITALLQEELPRIAAMEQIIRVYPMIPYAEEAQKHLYTIDDLREKRRAIEAFSFREGEVV